MAFLYVTDVSLLITTAALFVVDVESWLERLGRFQLVMPRSGRRPRASRLRLSYAGVGYGRSWL